jgi:hypothetical protein
VAGASLKLCTPSRLNNSKCPVYPTGTIWLSVTYYGVEYLYEDSLCASGGDITFIALPACLPACLLLAGAGTSLIACLLALWRLKCRFDPTGTLFGFYLLLPSGTLTQLGTREQVSGTAFHAFQSSTKLQPSSFQSSTGSPSGDPDDSLLLATRSISTHNKFMY